VATSEQQAIARFGERMAAALPVALAEAFGGAVAAVSVSAGTLPLLVMELGDGHHLHIEIEVAAGRHEPRNLLLVLRPEDAARLFDLEPRDPASLAQPDTQLTVLAEFTEGAEALAASLAGALAALGPFVSLRVSGASLEEADNSSQTALASLNAGDAAAFALVLDRAPAPMTILVGAPPDLAIAIGAGAGAIEGPAGQTAAERAANLAARVAARRAPLEEMPMMPPPPAAMATAHPFAFSQLDTPVAAARPERGVDLILDVALQVRVELGSTQMTVEEVLALGPGSVVELDRLAGEPVDIVVNDRLIARGEVVVVEENFGVRVTEIISARTRAGIA
jgi:flagellar motor switch protein FliN